MTITVIWAAIIALGLFMYVALDGFDLGVGMIFPFFPDDAERDLMMHSLAPIWDGNETWLVLGGAALFAAFPVVYAVALSALYLPIIFMLICLIFRGVSFEVREKAGRTKNIWSLAFILGSAGASLFQGIILGAYLQGIPVKDQTFSGDAFFWLTPFSLLSGFGLMITYCLLGCCWLIMKMQGDLRERLRTLVWPLTVILLLFMGAVSIWTPLSNVSIAKRWFSDGLLFLLLPIPVLVAVTAFSIFTSVRKHNDALPFVFALGLVLLGYIGLLISVWPYAIPGSLTLWEAAAPIESQRFALYGAVIIIPIILAYTTVGYWVFRGKIDTSGSSYH
jgi:cytochrome d ubiquinol oxidase subunit II